MARFLALAFLLLTLNVTARAQSGGVYTRDPYALPPIPSAPKTLPPLRAPGAATANESGAVAAARTRKLALLEPPDGRAYHGASLPDTWSESGLQAQLRNYEKVAGRKVSVVTWFASCYQNGRLTSWNSEYLPVLRRVRRAGAMSLIKFSVQDDNWRSNGKIADLRDVTRGVYDDYFKSAAVACREFGAPMWISFCHEMNGNWYPYSQDYGPTSPRAGDYIAAWRHVVQVFRAQGATNVAWMWAPNVPDVGNVSARYYYPGDAWVDWIGASFYSGNPLANLNDFYGQWAIHKPIFLSEWATGVEKNRYFIGFPGEARWVSDVFGALQTRFPRVKGVSWFQWDKADGNYLLQRVPEQQRVYEQAIAAPRWINSIPNAPELAPSREIPTREIVLREAGSTSGTSAGARAATPPSSGRETPQRETETPETVHLEAAPRENVKAE